jgi:LmbE family N-acetylglucosaminyl deacetylase
MLFIQDGARVLAIGAHPDDIELGAAGLIFRLTTEKNAKVDFLIMTRGIERVSPGTAYPPQDRIQDAKLAAAQLKANILDILNYPDTELRQQIHHRLIRDIETRLYEDPEMQKAKYDVILTHARADTHDDHRQVHDATISAARYFQGTILLYRAPSTIRHEFRESFSVALSSDVLREKQAALDRHLSQREKRFMWWTHSVLMAKSSAHDQRWHQISVESFEVYRSLWA